MTFVVERAEQPKVVGPKPVLAPYESPRVEPPKRGELMGKTRWSDLEFLKALLVVSREVEDKTVAPHPSILHKKHSQLLALIEAAHGEELNHVPSSDTTTTASCSSSRCFSSSSFFILRPFYLPAHLLFPCILILSPLLTSCASLPPSCFTVGRPHQSVDSLFHIPHNPASCVCINQSSDSR